MDWLSPIPLSMPGMLGTVACYLLRGPDGAVLIDTGMNDASVVTLLTRCLKEYGLVPSSLQAVICTHYHCDHAGLGAFFQSQGVPVIMSEVDARALTAYFSHPDRDFERALLYGAHGVPDHFRQAVGDTFAYLRSQHAPFVPDRTVKDGQSLCFAGRTLEVIATPGHTPGHICLLDKETGVLFAGDHILEDATVYVSLSLEDVCDDVLGAYLASLARIAALGPRQGFAGHGPLIADTSRRADQVARYHGARVKRVADCLSDRPMGCLDVSRSLFGDKRSPLARWLAAAHTLSCLEHLVARGEARMEVEDGQRRYRQQRHPVAPVTLS